MKMRNPRRVYHLVLLVSSLFVLLLSSIWTATTTTHRPRGLVDLIVNNERFDPFDNTTNAAAALALPSSRLVYNKTIDANKDKKDSTTVSADDKNEKPLLLLHVGPTKTATTTIQLGLVHHGETQQAMAVDGIHVPAGTPWYYKTVNQWRGQCLEQNNNNTKACQEWHERFQKEFAHPSSLTFPFHNDTTNTSSTTSSSVKAILKSCETFSRLPNNTLTRQWLQQGLQQTWQVRILMVHRRFSSWFPSRYYQYRKFRMFGAPNQGGTNTARHTWSSYSPKNGRWDKRTLGEFLQDIVVAQDFAGDVAYTYQWYSELFGENAIRVVTMHSQNGLTPTAANDDDNVDNGRSNNDDDNNNNSVLERFMCQAVNSPTACQLTKERQSNNKIRDRNANKRFAFDLDLLVVHAYHDYGLLGAQQRPKGQFVGRHNATKILGKHLQALQMTIQDDLPRLCLTPEQEEIVWQRTWKTEQLLWAALHRRDHGVVATANDDGPNQSVVRRQFLVDKARFCHVDPNATLQNATLRNLLFQPCLYWKNNPCPVGSTPLAS